MEEQGLLLSKDSLYSLLQGCIRTKDLACGRQLHSRLIFNGLGTSPHFGDHLIRLFASCGKLLEASLVFHKIMDPRVYTWNAIISAHAQFGEAKGALRLFYDMEEKHNVSPDQVTFLCILKAFNDSRTALEQVRLIHNWAIHGGLEADVALGSTFVDVYAKCGSMDEAHKVFNRLLNRNVVSWGAMISVCAQHKQDQFALQLFEKMQQEGIKPGRVVFLGTLKACGHTRAIDQGRLIHHQIINSGLQSEQSIGNSLIDMYAKCKSLEEARTIFDTMQSRDVVSWSAMLSGYVENGYSSSALNLFGQGQREGIEPDKVMFLCILKACSSTSSIDKGIMLHKQIHCSGLESDVVIGNALVDMYAKCGSVENARAVFDKMPVRQMVSWGAMISGYAQLGYGIFALELFEEMQHQGIEPNAVVFLGALKACSSMGSIRQGRLIHEHLVRSRLESDLVVGNAIIDMYVKSGSLEEANRLFRKMPIRDVVSWGGMITGYVQCGYYEVAGHYLDEMVAEGVKPDDQIFTTLLTACSHGGLLEEGRHYFKLMRLCGITPGVAHYNCMIDLLSRAGQLSEAENLLQSMPDCPDAVGWMSLLTNCRTYGHKQLGKQSYGEVMQADPRYASSYTLISNIYANAYMWEHASKTEDLRLCKGVMKKPGRAWIEVGNKAYEFIVGEQSHPQSDDIFTALRRLGRPMKKEGYLPQSDLSQEAVIYKVQALAFAAPICHLGP